MAKQLFVLIALSLGAIVFKTEISHVLDALVSMHNYIAQSLHLIFSDDHVGQLIQDLISLLFIPFVVGIMVAMVFWFIKRSATPHIMVTVWIMWLVLLVTMIAQSGMGPGGSAPQVASHSQSKKAS